ncbi:MAG: hypothetical protein EPN55_00540 [Gammaproteobacteria bacterium]|nr:MAG: hypothetical protein EPN55_00540 [Gammaproteobacteria bacterium]
MLCHLPAPYPDELLYSVITRYLNRTGASVAGAVVADVFGRRIRISSIDLPSSLNAVSERTWLVWGMTGEEIADRLTLFPYYARYVPGVRAARCLRALRSDNGVGVHTRLGVNGSRVRTPRFLRFCPTCRAHDLSLHGETYWRRTHQIPGVLVCPDHGTPLVESTALMKPTSFRAYFIDATDVTADTASAHAPDLGTTEAANALKIAKRCREMLSGCIPLWPRENVPQVYRLAALERGFSNRATLLSSAGIERAFVGFYGESLLSRQGCGIELGNEANWVRNIFRCRSNSRSYHSLQHALMQIFLESLPVHASKKMFLGLGPWKCPNPYATHEERLPIKRTSVSVRVSPSGELVASAKCSCGYCFTFSHTSDVDPSLPVVRCTRGLGPTWVHEAKRLRRSGLSVWAIAKKLDIAFKTAKQLITGNSPASQVSSNLIEQWRQEWVKLLVQVPNRRRVLARKMNGSLYKRLRRWDRDWLFAQPQFGSARRKPSNRIDWQARDMEWSKVLRVAAQKVKAWKLPRRVTPVTIVNASGLPRSICSYLDRLPLCRAVLNEYSEPSLDDSRERRLRAAASQARDRGLPLKDWVLKHLSRLLGKELSPRLNSVIQELVSGQGTGD